MTKKKESNKFAKVLPDVNETNEGSPDKQNDTTQIQEVEKRLKKKNNNKINYENIMESKSTYPILSEILDNDDKLLFSLNALGSLQKDEKLTESGDLLSIDDRWFLQGLRRWWSDDNRQKSSNKTLIVVSATSDRVQTLLNEDYLSRIKDEKKNDKEILETPEEKNFREKCEERIRLINKYFIALNKAKVGIENSRDTYMDKFTKNTFNLSIQRAEDILNKIQKFKGII